MIKLILDFYGTVCIFSSVVFVAFGLASSRKSSLDKLESIEEFDQFNGYRRFDFDPSVDGWSDADEKAWEKALDLRRFGLRLNKLQQ